MSSDNPTGVQHVLTSAEAGGTRAVVTELGASLRSLRVGGVPLVTEYPDDLALPGAAGIVLVPWPNRVAGATWSLEGRPQRLDVTEPDTGNAIHGLLRNTGYAVAESSTDAVTLTATVFPQHGYPFLLRTSVRYALTGDGLRVTHTVRNAGADPAPVAVGAHPYLTVGDTAVRDLHVRVAATTYQETDERGIPVADHPVAGTPYDLSAGGPLGELQLDTAFTGFALEDGAYRHRVLAADGTGVELWADPDFGWAQVFTSRRWPTGDGTALALEPMTAPANALVTGRDLRYLAPGETWTLSWGLRPVR